MPDAVTNFAYSTVATAPSPATSGTSVVVAAGQGALFPAVPFNAIICPTATQPLSTNAEIVRVTARTTDTLTITRAQEGTTARTVVVGDQIFAGLTSAFVTDITSRLGVISNFASPNAGGIVINGFYDNCFQGSASGTLIGAANRVDLAPYYSSDTFTADQIGVAVSTLVASAQGKVVIYATGTNGWPDALLFEGTTALDFSTTGYKFHAQSFQVVKGTQYWVGLRHSSTATVRTVAVASAVNLGLGTTSTAANYATILRRTLTFATAATDPWSFVSTDLVSNVTPPSIRFRAASVP